MKRILIFSLAYLPHVGGAELAIKEITERLPEYEFEMITLRFDRKDKPKEKIGNIVVHRIGFTAENVKVSDRALPLSVRLAKVFFPFASFFKALSLHREKKFDLLWAMMANQAGFGALFFKLFNPKIPYFLELQDGNTLQQVRKRRPVVSLLWPLYRRVYLKADVIKAISNFIKDLAREAGFNGRVEVIPNAVDVARFSAPLSEDKIVALKEKYDKKMGDLFIFTASRLVLSRGVEDIIRALISLPQNVKFLIAGDGEDRAKLEAIAQKSGVSERVLFAGAVPHADIPALLKISDIFVRPSIIEGMGSSFVEAFAAGIPVVATPVGGIPDFLSDPDRSPNDEPTGIFCNVRDPESVARSVKRYMSDPALTARIVRNAKELVAQRYDWNIVARDMRERIFEKL